MRVAFCLVLAEMTAAGFASLVFIPPHILGASFYRFAGLLYAACLAAALYMLPSVLPGAASVGVVVAMAAPVAAHAVLTWTRWGGIAYLLTWLSLPAAALFVVRLAAASADLNGLGSATIVASHCASALLTGAAMTAMLFGHWYLTTPQLPVRYLRRLNGAVILGLALVTCRAAISAVLLRTGLDGAPPVSLTVFGEIYVLARVLFGIVAAGVCVGFTWYCLREDSTQAATGFLYLVVCFCLMGEFISHFLTPQLRLPL